MTTIDVDARVRELLRTLETQRSKLTQQIVALRGVLNVDGGSTSSTPTEQPARRQRRRQLSAEQRKALSERLKAYWAKRRRTSPKQVARTKRGAKAS